MKKNRISYWSQYLELWTQKQRPKAVEWFKGLVCSSGGWHVAGLQTELRIQVQ